MTAPPNAETPRIKRMRALRALWGEGEPREGYGLNVDINVTPLVDVVLVLLIIFMVVTPLIASGVAVDLPRTSHHARRPDTGKDIIVSITEDERLFIGAQRVEAVEDLGARVKRERQKFPDKDVFVKGDARASFGLVRRVMDALYQAEITNITLGTEERPAPKSEGQ